jgi:hypothetical protein
VYIWRPRGSQGTDDEYGCVLECDNGYFGRYVPTFRMILLLPPSGKIKMKRAGSSETGT